MTKNYKRSFIMVFALFVFTILIVLVYALLSVARTEVIKAKSFIKRDRAYYLALRGVFEAKQRLLEELVTDEDSEYVPINLSQDWAQGIEEGIMYNYPAAKANLNIDISDESAYVDLNTFRNELHALFDKSFEKVNYDHKDDEYLSLIVDYEDEDDDERDLGSEEKAKNAPIAVLDELQLIFDLNLKQFEQFKELWGLAPHGAKLNINTASVDMINFLSEAFSEKYMFAEKAFDEILSYRSGDNGDFVDYFDREAWGKFVSDNPNLKTLFENCFTIDTSRFRIKSTVKIGDYSQCLIAVFDIKEKRFFYWRYE